MIYALYLLVGIIIGIFLTFACIKLSLVLPMINPQRQAQSPTKKQKMTGPRWHPGFLTPPGGSQDLGGPGPIRYESPDDFDPIDPKEELKKTKIGLGR